MIGGPTRTGTMPTTGQVLRRAEDYLARHGVAEPAATAERLLAHVLETDRIGLMTGERTLGPEQAKAFGLALCRRCAGTPVQHLTGDTGFRRLVVGVRPGVFIPRPETEILVERVLDRSRAIVAPRVVDVGTGTGAIALAIKDERPDASVLAIDVAPEAVALARDNAAALGLEVEFAEGDLLACVDPDREFDVVVSNPPYVPAARYAELPREVRADPHGAVVGDDAFYRALADQAVQRLVPGGVLAVEIDDDAATEVSDILGSAGFVDVELAQDLTGRDRVVSARRPS